MPRQLFAVQSADGAVSIAKPDSEGALRSLKWRVLAWSLVLPGLISCLSFPLRARAARRSSSPTNPLSISAVHLHILSLSLTLPSAFPVLSVFLGAYLEVSS